MNTLLVIIAIFAVLSLIFAINRSQRAIKATKDESRRYRSLYAASFRQLSLLTSWSEQFRPRLFYVRRIGQTSYAVFMQISLQSHEDPFPDGSRFAEVMIRRFRTGDPEFNLLLAEELAEKLSE